jgi:hypothetical protein
VAGALCALALLGVFLVLLYLRRKAANQEKKNSQFMEPTGASITRLHWGNAGEPAMLTIGSDANVKWVGKSMVEVKTFGGGSASSDIRRASVVARKSVAIGALSDMSMRAENAQPMPGKRFQAGPMDPWTVEGGRDRGPTNKKEGFVQTSLHVPGSEPSAAPGRNKEWRMSMGKQTDFKNAKNKREFFPAQTRDGEHAGGTGGLLIRKVRQARKSILISWRMSRSAPPTVDDSTAAFMQNPLLRN